MRAATGEALPAAGSIALKSPRIDMHVLIGPRLRRRVKPALNLGVALVVGADRAPRKTLTARKRLRNNGGNDRETDG
jgi:hypothetical protein